MLSSLCTAPGLAPSTVEGVGGYKEAEVCFLKQITKQQQQNLFGPPCSPFMIARPGVLYKLAGQQVFTHKIKKPLVSESETSLVY